MDVVLYVLVGLLGLAIGSFANVVIYRVPAGQSVVSPPSACPQCHTEILARDNVPVLGWLVLRGKCRQCSSPISPRYPLVEAATAALFVLMAWRFGAHAALAAFLYLAATGVVLAMIDIDTKRLPDAIVKPSWVVVAGLLTLAAATDGNWDQLGRAALGAAALGAFYFALWFAYPAGMGFGDVKLAPILGAALGWLSWGAVAVGAFTGFLLGGVFGIALIAMGRGGRKSKVPFGPFMLLGTLIGVLAGGDIAHAYLTSTGAA
ncbi:MAG: prepilin signal peptidase PulO-like peptidase [Frankiales bacterium]|nr:prepilin signal peptidase PulO-like peptidase [Frankiales bacterium]